MTRVGTRFWSNAVPALVSRVSVGFALDECTFDLILPNRLALKHGFGSAKPYLEISLVLARDVRPYKGVDHKELHVVLLKAIRDGKRSARQTHEKVESEGFDAHVPGDCPGSVRKLRDDLHEDNLVKADPKATGAAENEDDSDYSDYSEKSEENHDGSMSEVLTLNFENMPATPPRSRRSLARRFSSQKDVIETVPNKVSEKGVGDEVLDYQTSQNGTIEPNTPSKENAFVRDRALTAAIAKAFRSAGEAAQLTRQEIATAVGSDFSIEDLTGALNILNDEEKIFLTGDLVFLL